MFRIPLAAIPNQAISFNVDGAFWSIHVYQAIDHMYADVSRNGEVLITGTRCLVGEPLMPYQFMHLPNYGNFLFDADPDWTTFGESCNLLYLTLPEYKEFTGLRVA
jgi:hypothetical protein